MKICFHQAIRNSSQHMLEKQSEAVLYELFHSLLASFRIALLVFARQISTYAEDISGGRITEDELTQA